MKILNLIVVALLVNLSTVLGQQNIKIIDKPISYDSTRIKLSIEYLRQRHGIEQSTPEIKPVMVVLHWTAANTFQSTYNAFYPASLIAGDRKDLVKSSTLNTSSQFLIDRDGTIYRLMPENYLARHVIGLNYCAIGVENVGSTNFPLTKAQLVANEALVRYLAAKYPIKYLIGHYEYQNFRGSELWKETDPNYLTGKNDPGKDFMDTIKENLKDLNLKSKPAK